MIPSVEKVRRPIILWDVVTSSILLLIYLMGNVIATFLGFSLVLITDSCGSAASCDPSAIDSGITLAAYGHWIPVLPVLVVAIILMIIRRVSFWVPLVGFLLTAAIWFTGVAILYRGVGGN